MIIIEVLKEYSCYIYGALAVWQADTLLNTFLHNVTSSSGPQGVEIRLHIQAEKNG